MHEFKSIMINIDGSYAEGGGQILRTALALSVVTQKPFHITDIRRNRSSPGLKKQHLTAVKALEKLCLAKVSPFDVGTLELTFEPCPFIPQKLEIDIETAGAITLLLQSLLIPMVFAKDKTSLVIKGGTDVPWSMPVDFFKNVLVPHLSSLAKIELSVNKRGFYPRGGGELAILVNPKGSMEPIILIEQGSLQNIKGVSFATNTLHQARVAERMEQQVTKQLAPLDCPVNIAIDYVKSLSDGAGIVLWSKHQFGEKTVILGADVLGERGVPSEKVANTIAKKLITEIASGAAVDRHMADNLIPFLGLVGGKVKTSTISEHVKANIYVTEKFLGVAFDVDDENGIISVNPC